MLKKCMSRGFTSYCVCVVIQNIVCMIMGLCGATQAVTPDFLARVGGNMLTATFLQSLLIGLIGLAFGAGSVLFQLEHWSFLKQGAIHLAITAGVWIIVEYICFAPLTGNALWIFAVNAAGSYALIWGIQYFFSRASVRQLNQRIHQKNKEARP